MLPPTLVSFRVKSWAFFNAPDWCKADWQSEPPLDIYTTLESQITSYWWVNPTRQHEHALPEVPTGSPQHHLNRLIRDIGRSSRSRVARCLALILTWTLGIALKTASLLPGYHGYLTLKLWSLRLLVILKVSAFLIDYFMMVWTASIKAGTDF